MRETRTSRYANLRSDIENDKESGYSSNDLKTFAMRMNKYDDNYKVDESNSDHKPVRVRQPELENNIFESTYNDDYLETYLSEVKEYNKKEGYSDFEDTKFDIYKQFLNKQTAKNVKLIKADDVDDYQPNYDETCEIPFQANSSSAVISDEIMKMLNDQDLYQKEQTNDDDKETREFNINKDYPKDLEETKEISSPLNTSEFQSMLSHAYGSNRESLLNETQKIIVDFDNKHDLKHNDSYKDVNNDQRTDNTTEIINKEFNNITTIYNDDNDTTTNISLTDEFLLNSNDDFENLNKLQNKNKKIKKVNSETSNKSLNLFLNFIIIIMILVIAIIIFLIIKQRNFI